VNTPAAGAADSAPPSLLSTAAALLGWIASATSRSMSTASLTKTVVYLWGTGGNVNPARPHQGRGSWPLLRLGVLTSRVCRALPSKAGLHFVKWSGSAIGVNSGSGWAGRSGVGLPAGAVDVRRCLISGGGQCLQRHTGRPRYRCHRTGPTWIGGGLALRVMRRWLSCGWRVGSRCRIALLRS